MYNGKRRENYGRGEHVIDGDAAVLFADPQALVSRVRTTLLADGYEPPALPAVALELVELARDAEVPFSKIKTLIKTEPLIAAKLLRLSRSQYFARGAVIESLDDAITRLGLRTLGDLFLREALNTRVFRAPGFQQPMEALRKHAIVVAEVSREVCRLIGFPDEYAYMCGLLHDVGSAAAILVVADVGRGETAPEFEVVGGAIEIVHEEASQVLAKAWKLPEDMQLVLGNHHRFEIDGRVHPLAAAVCVADGLAAAANAGFGSEVEEMRVRAAQDALGLGASALSALAKKAEQAASAI